MDGGAALAADHEAAKATQPREGALDGPPAPARFPAAVHALAPAPRRYRLCRSTPSEGSPAAMARGARLDPAPAAAGMVVSFVGAALVRASARSALLARHGRDRIEPRLERHAVVRVGPGQQEGGRDAAPVGDEVGLGARLAAVRRVRPRCTSPLLVGMDARSTQARLQSTRLAVCSLRSSSRCKRFHTPASCQSRSRRGAIRRRQGWQSRPRQQVLPLVPLYAHAQHEAAAAPQPPRGRQEQGTLSHLNALRPVLFLSPGQGRRFAVRADVGTSRVFAGNFGRWFRPYPACITQGGSEGASHAGNVVRGLA